jgi:hypothetical protein
MPDVSGDADYKSTFDDSMWLKRGSGPAAALPAAAAGEGRPLIRTMFL